MVVNCDIRNGELDRVVKSKLELIIFDFPAEDTRHHCAYNRNFHNMCTQKTNYGEDREFTETWLTKGTFHTFLQGCFPSGFCVKCN